MGGGILKMTGWERRKARVRKKVKGTSARPRLNVFRSNKHIYAQLIDDTVSATIVSASTKDKSLSAETAKVKKLDAAKLVGVELARLATVKGIEKAVFDRSGYIYHGRVKALAEGAREGGLKF